MTLRVPYISNKRIERDAETLLNEFAYARRIELRPPIPIEDIVEKHLKLRVEFDDLHRLLGVPRSGFGLDPDIFGAIWLESGRIVIDESLDPEERPNREARYRFTLAHEGGGHWRLHRPLVCPTEGQGSFLIDDAPATIVCRSSHAKQPVEWQADFYASCLLMPRKMVFAAWDEAFPDRKQRVLQPETPIDHPFVEIRRDFDDDDHQVLESFSRPFAERFLVSPIAMRIRLEQLGLLHRVVPLQRVLIEG